MKDTETLEQFWASAMGYPNRNRVQKFLSYMKKRYIRIFVVVGLLIALFRIIYVGFETKTFSTYQLRQTGVAYQLAEYSEYVCGPDPEGGIDCDTDFWSELASESWFFTADNGVLDTTNIPEGHLVFDEDHSTYRIKGHPKVSLYVDSENFDRFSKKHEFKYQVLLDREYFIDKEQFALFSKYRKQGAELSIDFWYSRILDIKNK